LAILLAGKQVEEQTVNGERMWLVGSPVSSVASHGSAYILPAFDEFLAGYADRTAAVDPLHMNSWNDGGGILKPTIVASSRVVGTWKRRIERREVVFSPTPFTALRRSEAEAVDLALGRYARFLGLDVRRNVRARATRAGRV
jgi:hypothetical protein